MSTNSQKKYRAFSKHSHLDYIQQLKHLALSYNIGWEKLVGRILQRCDFCGFNSRFETNDDGSHHNFNDDDDDDDDDDDNDNDHDK